MVFNILLNKAMFVSGLYISFSSIRIEQRDIKSEQNTIIITSSITPNTVNNRLSFREDLDFLIITFINFDNPITKKINDDKIIPKNALLEPLNATITKKVDNKKIKSVLRYHLLKNIITAI